MIKIYTDGSCLVNTENGGWAAIIIIDVKKNYEENNIILDPHTAVGVGVVKKLSFNDCVVLSTAHPCKFPDATNNAINKYEKLPEELQHVLDKNENFQLIKNNIDDVKNFIKSKI